MSPVTLEHDHRLGPLDRGRLAIEVLVAYGRARRLLLSRTAPETVAELRRYGRRHPVSAIPGGEVFVGWRLAHAVTRTLRPLPSDTRCLSTSLTLLTLMERRDLHPTLIISAQPHPFNAHAWIELDGRPLLPPAQPGHERLVEL
jgi:hypothetical protein